MTVDPRAEHSCKSVIAWENLLKTVCEKPSGFVDDAALREALKSQGAFAKFSRSEMGIEGSSINTQKRHGYVILGGFDALDGLRLKAKALVDAQAERSTRRYGSRANLEQSIRELREEVESLREDLMLSTQVISLALGQGRSYAKEAGPGVVARCQREQKELLAFMTMQTNPVRLEG